MIVTGQLTTYPGRSKYQIVIETLEPAGLGALMALLEERKRKLAAEGLFDEARKQLLPFLPDVIGVVTSPTGAVIRDILHRLADRFPRHVLVWPVRVQGEGSGRRGRDRHQRLQRTARAGPMPRPDLFIVARGGGSLEDLWSFNEEIVVRAAADSLIPLISAVGHETDVTLIDFAADRRAPTPTAAAEMAVPVRNELLAISKLGAPGAGLLAARPGAAAHRTARGRARAAGADELLAVPRQRLDMLARRLPRALHANAQLHRTHLTRQRAAASRRRRAALETAAAGALERNRHHASHQLARKRERVVRSSSAEARARESAAALGSRAQRPQLLTAFSYRGVLARGFALVRDGEGHPLRSAAAVGGRMRLEIEFSDGRVGARRRRAASPRCSVRRSPSRAARRGGIGGQGTLF